MEKILATPRSFGKNSRAPVELLENAGYEVISNPSDRLLTREEMKHYIADCVGIVIGVDPLDAGVLEAAGRLRAIAKYGIGLDNVDLDACGRLGITVSITRGANSEAVADYTFALMAACARRLPEIDRRCRGGDWGKLMSLDIHGKTLGLFGLGAIGRGVVRRAAGFGMRVLAYDPAWDATYANTAGITYAEPETLLAESDFISLHLPLTDETRKMISTPHFAQMKSTAVLVNTARGGLVDEAALVTALGTGQIYAAGIDVFCEEPPENPALYELDNLIMGSHCAASTDGAVEAMGMMSARNLLHDLGRLAQRDGAPAAI